MFTFLAIDIQQPHDWIPTIGAIVISLLTGLIGWWKNKPKNRNDQFKIFMDESADFREEIRKEREYLKKELTVLNKERIELDKKLRECNYEVQRQITEITLLKEQLVKLSGKLL